METPIAPAPKKKPVASAKRTPAKTTKKPAAKPAAKKAAPAKKPAAVKAAPAKKVAAKKPAVKPAAKASAKPAAKKPVVKAAAKLSLSAKHCALIAHVLDENKAEDIVSIDLANKCSFADFMVVASGRSQRHVAALADHVADALKKAGMPPLNIEGKDSADWVLIDAGDVVVHLFRPEVRQFYNIEKMWAIAAPNA